MFPFYSFGGETKSEMRVSSVHCMLVARREEMRGVSSFPSFLFFIFTGLPYAYSEFCRFAFFIRWTPYMSIKRMSK